MENSRLEALYKQREEEFEKSRNLTERYENGAISKEKYDRECQGIETTADILGKEIEDEIKDKGISEQEYMEFSEKWKEEYKQEREQDRGR